MTEQQDGLSGLRNGLPSSTSAARISLTPAIETTVVTTTTTRTISYPPFVINAPKTLGARDPEEYPLAAKPTPASLRRLRFKLGDQIAEFVEANDLEAELNEYKSELSDIQSHHGTKSTSKQTPPSKPEYKPAASQTSRRRFATKHNLEDMGGSSTPISLLDDADFSGSEARELQSFHSTTQARPFASDAYRRPDLPLPYIDGVATENTMIVPRKIPLTLQDPPTFQKPNRPQSSRLRVDMTARPFTGSSTPPPQDFDENVCPTGASTTRSQAPVLIDTNPQEVSLPSPSLSPITAAAQMNRALPASKLRQTEYFGHTPPFLRAGQDRRSTFGAAPARDDSFDFSPAPLSKIQQPPYTPPASVTDITHLLDTFDTMPEDLQTYVMYQLLRRCSKNTLVVTSRTVAPALQVDFIKRLPVELRHYIIRNLSYKDLCRAAQVSKTWRQAVDSDEKAWSELVIADGFKLHQKEVERAIHEGWGWQYPDQDGWVDKDLTPDSVEHGDREMVYHHLAGFTAIKHATSTSTALGRGGRKRKRKESSRFLVSNERKRRRTEREQSDVEWPINWNKGFRPTTFADTALYVVPNPCIGLPTLANLHLFKSIYRRQFLMRREWLDPETKPKHIAFKAHEGHVVTCLQFDSEKILTGSDDAIIDIYDTTTGERLRRLSGHEGGVWALEYHENILVSGSTDRSVRIWNMDSGKCLHVFQGHTSTVRCLQIVQPVKTGTTIDGNDIMTPPQRLIITGSRDSSCRIWRLPKLGERSVFPAGPTVTDADNPYFVRALLGHTHSVRAIAAHANTLVSGSYDGTVRVWKISTGETVHRLSGHSTKVYSVVLDHARKRCISGSMDTIVKVWSLETGECLFNLSGHQSLVGLLDLKDDILVSAAADFTLKVWDPETGHNRHTLKAHTGAITCFAHDGNKVISGSERTLKMWDINTGMYVKDLLTDLRGVWQVRFDERRCIAAVHRNDYTFIEILDYGAAWDRVPESDLGRRIVVDEDGREIIEPERMNVADDAETTDEEDAGEHLESGGRRRNDGRGHHQDQTA